LWAIAGEGIMVVAGFLKMRKILNTIELEVQE
jgi:hypothetical protein